MNATNQDAAAHAAALSNYNEFMRCVQDDFDYVKQHEQQRYDSVVNTQVADYYTVVIQAQAELDRVTKDMTTQVQRVQSPNP